MPFGLENLTPEQRKLAMYGVPVVAAFALGTKLLKPKVVTPPATAGTAGLIMPSTSAVDVGQLGEFESSVTGALVGVQQQLDDLVNSPTTAPPRTSWRAQIPTVPPTFPAPVAAPIATPTPVFTPAPAPRGGAPFTYTVQAGDSLSLIAQKIFNFTQGQMHPTWQSIYSVNAGVIGPNPNTLRVGMVLVIPAT